jgi:hypothetical protein
MDCLELALWFMKESLYQPCISGDKAYPKIALPSKWSLFVTMTAESEPTQVSNDIPNDDEGLLEDSLDSDSDLGDFGDGSSMEEFVAAQPTVDELADISREGGDADLIVPDIPNRKEVYMIDIDPARFRSPEIAKFRSVVERSIGAMKKFRLLLNVAFISRLKHRFLMKLIVIIAALVNYELDFRKTPY